MSTIASTLSIATATITRSIASATNLGPMTTAVVFPSECSNLYNFQTTILGKSWSTHYTGGCAMSACCPSSKAYTQDYGWYSSYYSPAVCPQGYQTCAGPDEVLKTVSSDENVRFCCPGGYQCPLWKDFSICVTTRTTATSALVVNNISKQTVISTQAIPSPTGGVASDYAYPIQIRWKDSDFDSKSKSKTTSGSDSTQTASPSSETNSGESDSPVATTTVVLVTGAGNHNSGSTYTSRRRRRMSLGALIGTIVGAILGVIIVVIIACVVIRRQKKVKEASGNEDAGAAKKLGSDEYSAVPQKEEAHEMTTPPYSSSTALNQQTR